MLLVSVIWLRLLILSRLTLHVGFTNDVSALVSCLRFRLGLAHRWVEHLANVDEVLADRRVTANLHLILVVATPALPLRKRGMVACVRYAANWSVPQPSHVLLADVDLATFDEAHLVAEHALVLIQLVLLLSVRLRLYYAAAQHIRQG